MRKHLDDNTIIEKFNQGGKHAEKAFKVLVENYGEILYSQIRRIANNHEHTNDILQNVFIKVHQNLSNFNGDSALYTWMYRIARNESLNFIQKEKLRTGVDVSPITLEIMAGHNVLDTTSPETISTLLQEAIDTLPDKQSVIFQLKYFEELKYSEISSRLNTSEGALKASFHHAKKKIEKYIISKLNH